MHEPTRRFFVQYPPPFQPQGDPRRTRRPVWILTTVAGILALALIVVLVILLTKSDNTSTPPPGPGIIAPGPGTQPRQNTQASLADSYTGRSINRTAQQLGLDGSATITLQFKSKNAQALQGEIQVRGRDVGGTGLFEGTVNGDSIKLTVLPKDGVPSFQLTGTIREDGSIDGVLTVPPSAGDIAQTGEWQVQPRR